jgi:MOSC domain-containing protein YiiM
MSGAHVVHLQLKPGQGAAMRVVAEAEAVAGQGLRGDHHFGQRLRQVLIIERETLDEFDLPLGDVRENIVVEGLPLAGIPIGTQVRMGEALLEVTRDCAPCRFIEDKRPGLRAALRGRRGTLFRVVAGGLIRLGDAVELQHAAGRSAQPLK